MLRQLLLEALLLAMGGGIVGIALSFLLLRVGLRVIPEDVPRLYDVSLNGRVLTFAVLLSAATALVFGLLPAWRMSRSDPANALRDGGLTVRGGRRRNRAHHVLVVVETALGFTLLIGAGLLIRSLTNMLKIEPGFDAKHTVTFDVALTNKRYPDPKKVPFFTELFPKLAALPGVERVSSGHPLPMYWASYGTSFTVAGHLNPPDTLPTAGEAIAEPGYFEALSIPLLRGRTFMAHDNDPKSAPVAVINQSFARKYFPTEDPIGRYFTPSFDRPDDPVIGREIIGIVGDTRNRDVWNPYQPQFFLPYAQHPTHQRPIVVMKVAGDPSSYENAVGRVVATIDKVSGFAVIALLLSAVGLYSVLSYVVAERTRELGVRMALGASQSDVLQLVLRRGLALAFVGVAAGGLFSLYATKFVAATLFNVALLDPMIFATVAIALICVSVAAALVPALRAANVDPMRTLREQ